MESISHNITLFAEPISHFHGVPVTNALLTSWVAVLIIVVVSLFIRFRLRLIPGKIQSIFEVLVDGALDLCDQVTGDRRLSVKIFPLAISVFTFILINNWLGLL